jgi:hypothetical protein
VQEAAVGSDLDLGFMPLDDRPCNRVFPAQLSPIAGCNLLLPPAEMLGWFIRPGDADALSQWLHECPAQRFVVSLDMLCYGGLVASRTPAVSQELAVSRLASLRQLRQHRPDAVIFAFTTVMRLGTTVTSPETLHLHRDLHSYSLLVDRVERLGDGSAREELDAVAARLGPVALARYLGIRRRSQAVNRAALKLVADGTVDFLILCQEDSAPLGIHLSEHQVLRNDLAELGVADRVALHPGADESGLLLLARHLSAAAAAAPRIAADYAVAAAADTTPLYEHQSLRETVGSHIRAAGAELAPPGQADAILFLHTPRGPQQEAREAPAPGQSPTLALQAEDIAARIRLAHDAGRLVGLADIAYANGADPELIAGLQRSGATGALRAFAGWNTAANTVGTVVSQLVLEILAAGAGSQPSPASSRFLACRFADDYGYQSCIRPKAQLRAEAEEGNPFDLGQAAPAMEQHVRQHLEPFAHALFSALLPFVSAQDWGELKVSLPWKRLFEVEVAFSAPS